MVSTRAAWLGLLAATVAAAVPAQEGSTATAGEEKRFRLSG